MQKIAAILSVLLLTCALFSCQKELSFENGSDNNPSLLQGNWKFLELNVAVESGSTFDYGGIPGKIVATYVTTTQNNTGLLTVTTDKMKMTDLGYTISVKVKIVTYIGGIPVDPQPHEEQLDFELPPSNAICDYRQAGSDSLYFPNGFLFDIPDTNGQQLLGASDPAGARFTITGDTLIIQSSVNRSTVTRQGNDEYEVTQKVNGTATFVRQ